MSHRLWGCTCCLGWFRDLCLCRCLCLSLCLCLCVCVSLCLCVSVSLCVSGAFVHLRRWRRAHAAAMDAQWHQLKRGDRVKITAGPHSGKDGTIKHIHRTFLFLHSYQHPTHNGVFCVRSRHATAVGQKVRTGCSRVSFSYSVPVCLMVPPPAPVHHRSHGRIVL